MNNTEVVEDKSHFKTEQFSNGFITFDEAKKSLMEVCLVNFTKCLLSIPYIKKTGFLTHYFV